MEKLKSGAAGLGIHLTEQQLEKFETYYRELAAWNEIINLTSITGYEDVQVKHFLDSLTVTAALPPDAPGKNLSVIDIGTGAGLPGIPLKIVLPGVRLVLLEATVQKTKFLQHLLAQLDLADVEVVTGRAEEVARDNRYRERFDLALSRAVAALPALSELALPFCAIGGAFVAQKKGDISLELARARKAIELLGGRLREIMPVSLE